MLYIKEVIKTKYVTSDGSEVTVGLHTYKYNVVVTT